MNKFKKGLLSVLLMSCFGVVYAQASVKMLNEDKPQTGDYHNKQKAPLTPDVKSNQISPLVSNNQSATVKAPETAVEAVTTDGKGVVYLSDGEAEKKVATDVLKAKKAVFGTLSPEDLELSKRIRKFFIVSDYMIQSPYEYAGYLLFRQGIEDKLCDLKKPDTFYMLDHEGGRVNRIKSGLPAAEKFNPDNADDYYHQWNKDLTTIKSKCVNVVLGPTIDINFGDRSYTKDMKKNLQISLPMVNAVERKGMLPVVKHFPGEMFNCVEKYARKEVRNCPQSFEEINEEWKNFNGSLYPSLMISNHIYEKASPLPAVMEDKMYSYLRNQLKYQGLIITDALWEMSVPVTPKSTWAIFKNVDLMLLINPEQVEKMLPYLVSKIKEMPEGSGIKLLEEKEARIKKAKLLIK